MPRKSKKAAKPRTNKQGSINVAGSLHQMVKDYCVEHSMTQVEFIEVSLKVLKLIPGDPRLWTDEVPTPITQAIANLQSAEQAFREFMQTGQDAPHQSYAEPAKPAVLDLKPAHETPLPSTAQSAPVKETPSPAPAEPIDSSQKAFAMFYQSAQNKFDRFIPLTEAEQIAFIKHKKCPQCGGALIVRSTSNGDFIGCKNYYREDGAKCDYTANGNFEKPEIKKNYHNGVKRISFSES